MPLFVRLSALLSDRSLQLSTEKFVDRLYKTQSILSGIAIALHIIEKIEKRSQHSIGRNKKRDRLLQ